MTSSTQDRRVSSLRSLLLWWIIGSGIVLIIVYSAMLEYSLRFGVVIRTKAEFEHIAAVFAERYAVNPNTPLPAGPGLQSYPAVKEIPPEISLIFPENAYEHGEILVFHNEYDDASTGGLMPQCDGVPCEMVFFYSYQLNDNEWLYMSQGIVPTEKIDREMEFSENIAHGIALTVLVLFSTLALLLVKKIGNPVRQLAAWADGLTTDQIEKDVPDFQYRELNLVADRLNGAFGRISQTLEKEHRFLQHASHELRTPIAVASGNLELLEKLTGPQRRSEAETQAFDRLKYAMRDMQQLTETLLWLNRDSESLPPGQLIDLKALVNRLTENNTYLLSYKSVDVDVVGQDAKINAPLTLCRIVLANLIRNAFQYTYEGRVLITVSGEGVTVCNENSETQSNDAPGFKDEYGFGLGLDLVEQIAKRLGWSYEYEVRGNGRSCTILFNTSIKI